MGVTPYMRVTSLSAKQVCLGPVKRATCTDFVLEKVEILSILSTGFASILQNKFHLVLVFVARFIAVPEVS